MINIAIKILNIILEIIYLPFKLFPTKKKITFISRESNEESVDIMMLRKAIEKDMPDCEVVSLMKLIEPGLISKIGYCFHMLRQMYHIATSRIVILDTYCIVISLLHHKRSLTTIQMWHALGLMKKAGYSILGKKEGRNSTVARAMKLHKNYRVIFASSENCRYAIGEVFNYPVEYVYSFPLPRVDLLRDMGYIQETQKKIWNCYPELRRRKVILYAPTFRKDETIMKQQIDKMIDVFSCDEYNIIINLHPLSKITVEDKRVITNAPFSTMELLTVADYVISDYSSIIYEAAIMRKPLFFFAFDLDTYQGDRDFFIDYRNEVPGTICMNAEEVADAINNYQYDEDRIVSFASRYVDLTVNNCTGNILEYLKQLLGRDYG